MRVLLDAHVSSRHIGGPLEARGHDVLALDRDRALSALADVDVLRLAAREGRVLVTHNIRHFAPIVRRWAEGGQTHAGCILVTLPHDAYGAILRGLDEAFRACPEQRTWIDRAQFLR